LIIFSKVKDGMIELPTSGLLYHERCSNIRNVDSATAKRTKMPDITTVAVWNPEDDNANTFTELRPFSIISQRPTSMSTSKYSGITCSRDLLI
jgi:hypothetical protein